MKQPFAFDAYVIDQQEKQEAVLAWNEYRCHGGKLDFTAWEEKQENKKESL